MEWAISFTYYECVFVALGIQRAMRMRHIFICSLHIYHIFSHYLIHENIFRKKLLNMKSVLWISLQILSDTFLILRRTEWQIINIYMYIGLHVKYTLLLPDFNDNWTFSAHFLKKYSHIKFHENPSSGSRVVPCGRTDTHDEANGRFRNFAKAPKKTKPLTQLTVVVATYQQEGW